jgi:NADH:ubiquinone oxidoreductase subunit C
VRQYLQGGMDAFMMKPMPSDQQEVAIICMTALESAHRHGSIKRAQNLDMFNAMTFERKAFDLVGFILKPSTLEHIYLNAITFERGAYDLVGCILKTQSLNTEV